MNNIYGVFFICKVGKKEKTRYITLENVKPYNKLLTNEVMKSKDDDLVQKKFTYKQCQFNYNIFYRMGINKKKKILKKILIFIAIIILITLEKTIIIIL